MTKLKLVSLEEIWRAMEECLAEAEHSFDRRETDHHWWIYSSANPVPYRGLPKGPHGKRVASRTMIQVGHARSLARHFGVLDCVRGRIKGL